MSSELETIQISFPSEANSDKGFEPFEAKETSNKEMGVVSTKSSGFQTAQAFWDAVNANSHLKDALEKEVDRRVHTKLNEDLASEKAQIRETARQEGLEEGKKQALQDSESLQQAFKEAIESIKLEKLQVLNDHQELWIKALQHVCHRLRQSKAEKLVDKLKEWLEESQKRFELEGKLCVRLSPIEYEHLKSVGEKLSNCEIKSDNSLELGDVRVESGVGGIFFSREKQFERLDRIFDQFLSEESK